MVAWRTCFRCGANSTNHIIHRIGGLSHTLQNVPKILAFLFTVCIIYMLCIKPEGKNWPIIQFQAQ